MADVDVSDLVAQADEALAQYEAVMGSDLPSSLKAAIASGEDWLEQVQGAQDIINHLAYTHRKADKQRLIALPTAIAILRDYEDALVGSLVSRWGALLDSQVFGTADTVVSILRNLASIVQAFAQAARAKSLLKFVTTSVFKAVAIPEFAKDAAIAFNLASKWELTMANRKFKQNRHARRYRRRAVSRRA